MTIIALEVTISSSSTDRNDAKFSNHDVVKVSPMMSQAMGGSKGAVPPPPVKNVATGGSPMKFVMLNL